MVVPKFRDISALLGYLEKVYRHTDYIQLPDYYAEHAAEVHNLLVQRGYDMDRAYKASRYTVVRLEDIRPTQQDVEVRAMLNLIYRIYTPTTLPWVVSWKGKPYLMDGHNRIWLSIAMGQERAPIRTFKFRWRAA
jgi:hypothetical protein